MRVLPSLAGATATAATAAVIAGAVLGTGAPAGAQTTGTTSAPAAAGDPGQAFFHDALVKDPKTTSAIRKALARDAAIVDPATQYADLTGDGRSDAVVRVHSAGAAGVIAVYVFSTHGRPAARGLRVLYRSQSLYRAVTTIATRNALQVDEPLFRAGDDVCCPSRLTRRRYAFAAKSRTFVRTSRRTITLSGSRR